ncbi:hypothetical protein F511_09784 [Dorcoceras hygrometricum]|uniref:Integrase catalytic domain-containing protein n=1 Tax=Dorcoceras hygrometricum TaxID=472368 RepID=A0A2Z7A7Q8_9LAMI|nr:hypothetical protein F511_09784 [Dorcoceras hygrometricum]
MTDNVATSYFQTQKKLSPKQARWQDFLAEFDYELQYKPGRVNVVADALSRKSELAAISIAQGHIKDLIKEGLAHDPQAQTLLAYIKDGKTRRFWQSEGLLCTKGNRLYVPAHGGLRREVLKECHDSKWAGHPGIHRTLSLVEDRYYWPHIREDVEAFVKTCLVCQQDKGEAHAPKGLLQPLPIPEHPWASVSMDFIIGLPPSEGCGSIIVVVDRFSKYATFIPAPKDCTAEQAAGLFLKHVVKYWGVPGNIVSDRDPRFTGKFWTELFKLLGSHLSFSTSMHPQTDGQTERVNALLEAYLRHFVSASQRDWAKLLDVAQFSFNLQPNESTSKSPFELILGYRPTTPQDIGEGYTGANPAAYKFAKEWQEQADIAKSYLHKAAKRMKKWADKKRTPAEFTVGDLVLVKIYTQQKHKGLHKGLIRRYEGPFRIEKRIGKVAYKLELPPKLKKFYPVFHVSLLKPFQQDMEDPDRNSSKRAPIGVKVSYDWEVEAILADRVVRRKHHPPSHQYLVKWKGLPDSETSWEPSEGLWQFEDHVSFFHKGNEDVAGTSGGGCHGP